MIKYLHSNTAYIPFIMIVSTLITILSVVFYWGTTTLLWGLLLAYGVYFLTGCTGITMTFHRYASHSSFRFRYKWMEYLFSVFGALGGTGSLIGWTAVHKLHHKYSDTERDPHSPIHLGWRIFLGAYNIDFNKWTVRKWIVDPFHRIVHEYYYGWLLLWGIFLSIVSWLIGWPLVLFGFIVPVAIQIWMSNLSNYFNHSGVGERPFKTTKHDYSHNVWWLSLPTWGEGGGHNFHHRYAKSYSFVDPKIGFWKRLFRDPTGLVIEAVR